MTLRSGRLRDVIKIQRRSTTQDANGEESATWTLVGERRAEMVATPGREVWSSKERHARVPTVFRIRFPRDFDVLPQMRVVYRSRVFDITSAIDEDGRREEMLLTCDELVGEPQ